MSDRWGQFRLQMPVAERWAYFDHAAVAPLSLPASRALVDWADEMASNGEANWSVLRRRVGKVRESVARLLNCSTDEIAFVPNTTSGLSIVAESFPWQPGDNIVLPANEFPSNALPWRNLINRDVEVRAVPCDALGCDEIRLMKATDEKTRIVSVSWVDFATGWRRDLDLLADQCHQRGILLCVDGIQGAGVIPLDLQQTPVDFFVADGHKWLLGPEGAGILFIRANHLERLRPIGIGWNSLKSAGNFDRSPFGLDEGVGDESSDFRIVEPLPPQSLKNTAARFEGGSQNVGGILALGASIELIVSSGSSAVWLRLQDVMARQFEIVTQYGGRVLSSLDTCRRSGIMACEFPNHSPLDLRDRATQQGVVLNVRRGYVRLSPHVYTNESDFERLSDLLKGID
jgi:cysteine desulfurase/selenocysteine lyase